MIASAVSLQLEKHCVLKESVAGVLAWSAGSKSYSEEVQVNELGDN